MSDTPRTDAEEKGASYFTGVEMRQAWNLARQLEREIADAQQRLREWRDLCEKADRENAELSDQVMRWFKAASPYATPGSLEEGMARRRLALRNLMKESAAMMALCEPQLREAAGNTNVAVLRQRIEEAAKEL